MIRGRAKHSLWLMPVRRVAAKRHFDQGVLPVKGVSQPAYFAWRKKLALGKSTNAPSGFVPVQVAPDTLAPSSGIEIVLDRGRRVRVEPGFDRQLLSAVLSVLEEGMC